MSRKSRNIIASFELFALLFPLLWLFLLSGYKFIEAYSDDWIYSYIWVDYSLIFLWPSSFLLIADPAGTSIMLPIVSIFLNAVYFLLIGALSALFAKKGVVYLLIPGLLHLTVTAYLIQL